MVQLSLVARPCALFGTDQLPGRVQLGYCTQGQPPVCVVEPRSLTTASCRRGAAGGRLGFRTSRFILKLDLIQISSTFVPLWDHSQCFWIPFFFQMKREVRKPRSASHGSARLAGEGRRQRRCSRWRAAGAQRGLWTWHHRRGAAEASPIPHAPVPVPAAAPVPAKPVKRTKVGPTIGSGYEPCPESTGVLKVFTVGPTLPSHCQVSKT